MPSTYLTEIIIKLLLLVLILVDLERDSIFREVQLISLKFLQSLLLKLRYL